MSDSVRPHRRQPTRLPHPWDSPGKNTGVGCHFLLQCMKVKSESEVAQSCQTLRDPMDCSLPGSSVHGISQARVLEWVAIAFSEGAEIFTELTLFSMFHLTFCDFEAKMNIHTSHLRGLTLWTGSLFVSEAGRTVQFSVPCLDLPEIPAQLQQPRCFHLSTNVPWKM